MRIAETAYPLPDGRVLTIRSAEPKDAASLALHRCITSGETPFMARYPEECTRDAEARENGFEQIELGVFADNVCAIHLYQSLGFEDFGCTPRAFRLKDGTYHDERMLVKFL